MFVRSVFDCSRSGVCECVHRKRFVILIRDRKGLLKKVHGTFNLPGIIDDAWNIFRTEL